MRFSFLYCRLHNAISNLKQITNSVNAHINQSPCTAHNLCNDVAWYVFRVQVVTNRLPHCDRNWFFRSLLQNLDVLLCFHMLKSKIEFVFSISFLCCAASTIRHCAVAHSIHRVVELIYWGVCERLVTVFHPTVVIQLFN